MDPYQALEHFYHWNAPVYDLSRRFLLAGRAPAVSRLALRPGERVVEIGCGTGSNFARIRRGVGEHGEIVGLDLSGPMLAVARRRASHCGWHNVTFIEGRAEELSLDRPADAALCSYSLTMIPDWRGALDRIAENLAPGGRLAVADFRLPPAWPPWIRDAYRRYLNAYHVHPERPIVRELRRRYARVRVRAFGCSYPFTAIAQK